MNTKQVFVYRKYRDAQGNYGAELLDVLNFNVIDLTGLNHALKNNMSDYDLDPDEQIYFRFTGVDQEFRFTPQSD